MQNRKQIESHCGYILLQVDILDSKGNVIRSSYEVLEPSEDVIGRFGSLKEAKEYMELLYNPSKLQRPHSASLSI